MRERLLFIYNPHAGKTRIKSKLSDVIETFAQQGYEVIIMPTLKHGDATEYAMEFAQKGECSRIVCAGGDGTLSEVVAGVLKSGCRVPIGFIPAGTTNDFGYSLKIPKDIVQAAELAGATLPIPSDTGEINGKVFIYTAAFGLFADVSYDTSQNVKNVLGRSAYILSGASKLHNVKSYHLTIEYIVPLSEEEAESENSTFKAAGVIEKTAAEIIENGTLQVTGAAGEIEFTDNSAEVKAAEGFTGNSALVKAEEEFAGNSVPVKAEEEFAGNSAEVKTAEGFTDDSTSKVREIVAENRIKRVEGDFIYGMISNSDSVGGFKGIAGKGVQFDDGIFEMLLVRKPHNLIELTDIINELLSKKLNSENIVYARTSGVRLVSDQELPWSLDGEYGGDMPQAEIHIRKQSVDYIKLP